MNKTKVATLGVALSLLAGCFSGSSGSSSGSDSSTGVFVDSPVAGLTYSGGGDAARTDEEGRFNYDSGQTLSFSVGGLALGSATGADIITPVDLVEGADAGDTSVINISRLLQSLDSDGNLNNGIQITEAIDQALQEY